MAGVLLLLVWCWLIEVLPECIRSPCSFYFKDDGTVYFEILLWVWS